MFWNRKSDDEKLKVKLLDLKKVKIEGFTFIIKKINPLLDFPSNKIPPLFTDFVSRRPTSDNVSVEDMNKLNDSIKPFLLAGIYKPNLMAVDSNNKFKEPGLTINDLFIDPEVAYKLFYEITSHSLCYFKGLKGLFFSIRIKLLLSIRWLISMRFRLSR